MKYRIVKAMDCGWPCYAVQEQRRNKWKYSGGNPTGAFGHAYFNSIESAKSYIQFVEKCANWETGKIVKEINA